MIFLPSAASACIIFLKDSLFKMYEHKKCIFLCFSLLFLSNLYKFNRTTPVFPRFMVDRKYRRLYTRDKTHAHTI